MSDDDDFEFFNLRKQGKTYISKVFTYNAQNPEPIRQVRIVFEGSDQVHFGEIHGAMCLRISGRVRKNQITALISQDDKKIKRVTLQSFKESSRDRIQAAEKNEFTFRSDEFERLVKFLAQIDFIDLSNDENFQIEDLSRSPGPKAIVDASDRGVIERITKMSSEQKRDIFRRLHQTLSDEEINILLGRRQGLNEFELQMKNKELTESEWQNFFDREQWVFGYGLDYRVMRPFDREMTVGGASSDNREKPIIDFLMTFTDYTVLVEIKRPDTNIFRSKRSGRAGTWEFSAEFMSAISQIIEQKAEWLSFSQTGNHFNRSGTELLEARTRNAKSILVIGSKEEFSRPDNARESTVMRDTFELFRRECRGIDIITFDELLERAQFIARNQ